jgi:hypothetical protein
MKKVSLDSASVLSIGLVLVILSTVQVSAQPLVTSTPTTEGVNISINPDEPLPTNGTVGISTEGAIDTDMNIFPPVGATVVISNDTVTVTNQPVDIATADEEELSDDEEDGGAGVNGDEEDEQGGEDGVTAEAADSPADEEDE